MQRPILNGQARGSPRTPTEQLRDALTALEKQIGLLGHGTVENALTIPEHFDEVERRFEVLALGGIDPTAERARYETLSAQYRSKGRKFLRAIGGPKALEEARAHRAAKADAWWWNIDRELAEQRRENLRRSLKSLAITAAVLIVLGLLYWHFLEPDAQTRERLRREQEAGQLLELGDPAGALAEIDLALEIEPDSPDLLLVKAVALDELGRTEEAEAYYARTRALLEDETQLLFGRAQLYLRMRRFDAALADAERAYAMAPDSPQANFYMGTTYAAMGEYFVAYEYFERTAQLAGERNEIELEGMARVQMAMLMQQMAAPPITGGMEEP